MIVLPRQPELQEKLIAQSRRDAEIQEGRSCILSNCRKYIQYIYKKHLFPCHLGDLYFGLPCTIKGNWQQLPFLYHVNVIQVANCVWSMDPKQKHKLSMIIAVPYFFLILSTTLEHLGNSKLRKEIVKLNQSFSQRELLFSSKYSPEDLHIGKRTSIQLIYDSIDVWTTPTSLSSRNR